MLYNSDCERLLHSFMNFGKYTYFVDSFEATKDKRHIGGINASSGKFEGPCKNYREELLLFQVKIDFLPKVLMLMSLSTSSIISIVTLITLTREDRE